jgi:hypothetical protein
VPPAVVIVTSTEPANAPAGTTTESVVSLIKVGVAELPSKETLVAVARLTPEMVIVFW